MAEEPPVTLEAVWYSGDPEAGNYVPVSRDPDLKDPTELVPVHGEGQQTVNVFTPKPYTGVLAADQKVADVVRHDPHWKRGRTEQYPVAFLRTVRGGGSRIFATVRLTSAKPMPAGVELKGEARYGDHAFAFETEGAAVLSADAKTADIRLKADKPLPGKVRAGELTVKWTATFGGRDAAVGGSSANAFYLTLAPRLTTVHDHKTVFHTVLHVGCTAGDGAGDERKLADGVVVKFATLKLTNHKGDRPLTYWKPWEIGEETPDLIGAMPTVGYLLAKGNSTCGPWCRFFVDVFRVQGVAFREKGDGGEELSLAKSIRQVKPLPKMRVGETAIAAFLVKNWAVAGKDADLLFGKGRHPFSITLDATEYKADTYPYVNLNMDGSRESPPVVRKAGVDAFAWLYADVVDKAGTAGQGSADPRSYFTDHVVVVMPHLLPGAKRFFDVSYGVAYDDLDDMRKKSLDYLVLVELKELTPDVRDALKEKKIDPGKAEFVYVFLIRPADGNTELYTPGPAIPLPRK